MSCVYTELQQNPKNQRLNGELDLFTEAEDKRSELSGRLVAV